MTGHGGTIVGYVFFFSFKTKLETREAREEKNDLKKYNFTCSGAAAH